MMVAWLLSWENILGNSSCIKGATLRPRRDQLTWIEIRTLGSIDDRPAPGSARMSGMHFLGIDVSTTASKALLVDEKGAVIASASCAHTMQNPKPLWSEQDPEEWWTAVSASIRAVLR